LNKLDNIGGGVKQAEGVTRTGLLSDLFPDIDCSRCRRTDGWNVPNRGIDPTATVKLLGGRRRFKSIIEFPLREELHQDIGILFMNSYSRRSGALDDLFTVRICVHHQSTPQSGRETTRPIGVVAYLRQLESECNLTTPITMVWYRPVELIIRRLFDIEFRLTSRTCVPIPSHAVLENLTPGSRAALDTPLALFGGKWQPRRNGSLRNRLSGMKANWNV